MKKISLITLLLLAGLLSLQAEVKMPHIFGDNMVLQRNQKVKVWGWADKGEAVTVTFNGQTQKAKAGKNGKWMVTFTPMQAGGPYTMVVAGKKNKIEYNNILIGEVWVCSGQSNMEWTLANAGNAEYEIRNATYPAVRAFNVAHEMDFSPRADLNGSWDVCSPETAGNFSAVGYFFARKLYQELNVPIGIINTSWGGTIVETWTSPETFNALPDKYKKKFEGRFDSTFDVENFMKKNEKAKEVYFTALKNDFGMEERWYLPQTDISSWKPFDIPQGWWNSELKGIEGYVWFRYDFTLSSEDAGKSARLSLGPIDDMDITWVNGVKVGEADYYNIMRDYAIPEGVLQAGKNSIVVRVDNPLGEGGINGKAEDMYVTIDGKAIQIAGKWKYKPSVINKDFDYIALSPNIYSSLLYNAMVNPIIDYGIKGAIWYQGESNADIMEDAENYKVLFPAMIKDWRAKWGYEFPFYWVQLANYMAKDVLPQESNWATLREAQTQTLSLPKTGQAVIVDIGETNDIHPRNKQDVGLRLALNALNKDYGMTNVIYSGPTYKSMVVEGNKAVISYDNIAAGLTTPSKYGYIESFAIAGADSVFHWAKAYIDGDKVVVYSDKVQHPVAVRYGWSDNPDINLYNSSGLPAAPFRTDNW
ncbi:sialate O-acetylesterase [Dysgonomonas sp. 25]|uniref:sialate O-acetylesterase n=1 Tax=Dysgonomonas sp. 25 TaxID=2302933 RepID=UPI0013D74ECA|nr:sialate O-acetylesterase [Dysgonomonas sp. 25]NDV68209.1 9-O-acetylesterase [Dysgonomonas sp. 25]